MEGKDAEDTEPIGPQAIGKVAQFNHAVTSTYRVFNVTGKMVGTVEMQGKTASQALTDAGFNKGIYMLRSMDGKMKFMATAK